jgi:hypothetical protein
VRVAGFGLSLHAVLQKTGLNYIRPVFFVQGMPEIVALPASATALLTPPK